VKVELVNFYPFEVSSKRPRILAYADVRLDGKILIRGIRLYEAKNGGLFIVMPEFSPESRRAIVEIEDRELLEKIRRVVVDRYKESLS
jgi:stage V sporulation protein G